MTPASVQHLTRLGHEVWVQASAGSAIGFSDAQYQHAGAVIVNADQVFAAPLVIKVKEPSVQECSRLRAGQVLFCYFTFGNSPNPGGPVG